MRCPALARAMRCWANMNRNQRGALVGCKISFNTVIMRDMMGERNRSESSSMGQSLGEHTQNSVNVGQVGGATSQGLSNGTTNAGQRRLVCGFGKKK